jgi:hypothetical protein
MVWGNVSYLEEHHVRLTPTRHQIELQKQAVGQETVDN